MVSKNFFYENFFLEIFFLVKILIINFFLAKIFLFTKIFLRRFFSQYFREFLLYLMFAEQCILRNFLFEILLVANFFVLQFWCAEKKLYIFLRFFFQQWTWIPNLKMCLLKKSKIFSDRTFGFLYSLLGK